MYLFKKTYPQSGHFGETDPKVIEDYRSLLPTAMLDIWEKEGWAHYHDGFFSLTNPEDYQILLAQFFPDETGLYVLMRTAFGGMIFWDMKDEKDRPKGIHRKLVNYFDPVYQQSLPLGDDPQMVFDYWLTTESLVNKYMYTDLYSLARKRLARPKADECYGFVPALALGGEMVAENIKLLKLSEHLLLLSQV